MNETIPPALGSAIMDALNRAAVDAGAAILEVRAKGHTVETKADQSPVTEADRAAEALIMERLAAVTPDIPVVAEEAVYAGRIPENLDGRYFLVDPLDGTREFARGGNDFTVNIGLVDDGMPVAGVIYVPATGQLYVGEVGPGAWRAEVTDGVIGEREAINVREPSTDAIDVVASRSHRTGETDNFISCFEVGSIVSAGSSLKFCVVAEGRADLYPRMGTTMQWDTAAGEAILRAAGGFVVTAENTKMVYRPRADAAGPDMFRNPWFVASGGMDAFAE